MDLTALTLDFARSIKTDRQVRKGSEVLNYSIRI